MSLDSALHESISLIKMDVEGAEFRILRGMPLILAQESAKIIFEFCPSHLARLGDDAKEFLNVFADYGFTIYEIVNKPPYVKRVAPAELLEKYTIENGKNTNVFATKK
ncbi:MAG: hypothetical protein EAX81_07795 [Candidatus Thorarchaeota archaeon]|nr:hypothetical protein [Candidatus Thorarchaeota archaeon]